MLAEASSPVDEEWPPELEALRDDPVMMLLAGVVLRARRDAAGSGAARRFLERVRRGYARTGDAAGAVAGAMTGGDAGEAP